MEIIKNKKGQLEVKGMNDEYYIITIVAGENDGGAYCECSDTSLMFKMVPTFLDLILRSCLEDNDIDVSLIKIAPALVCINDCLLPLIAEYEEKGKYNSGELLLRFNNILEKLEKEAEDKYNK